jgi:signal transduction histidine kinase
VTAAVVKAQALGGFRFTRSLVLVAGVGVVTLVALAPYVSARSQPISDYPGKATTSIAAHVAVGAAFIAVGLLAWARRPLNRTGKLMTLAGFVWFSTDLGWISTPVTFVFADDWRALFYVFLIWLLLAFPGGRLGSRVDRAFVIAVAVWVVLLRPFPSAAFYDPHREGPFDAPRNPLLLRTEPRLNARIDHLLSFGDLALIVVLLVLVANHWRCAGRHARRWLAPAFVLAAVSTTASSIGVIESQQTLLNWIVQLTLLLLPLGFLVGVLRSRLARASVADLVLELERAPGPAGVRAALARALDDPTLEVGYRLANGDGYVDADGRALDTEPREPQRAATVVRSAGESVAVLVHESSLTEEPELVEAVTAAAKLALENQRLHAELRAQLEEVRASRARIVAAGDAERRRIERNLHDGAQQRLVALGLAIQLARDELGDHELLAEAERELQEALHELRELARGIHPAILADAGLAAALRTAAERSPVPVSVDVDGDLGLPPAVESTAYFVVAEALTNIARHADASRASLVVERRNGRLHLTVEDDGLGGADPARGSGLRGLSDRVAASGGSFAVHSRPGSGTQIEAELPCE